MRQQRADDHTVRRKQESGIESKPADESGVTCHQDKQWQFFPEAVKCALKVIHCKIKVDKPANSKCDEVHHQ